MDDQQQRPSATWDHTSLWRHANACGIDRRAFLGLLAAGGATAVLAACGENLPSQELPQTPPGQAVADAAKRSAPGSRIRPPSSSATTKAWNPDLENMQGLITPNRLFFVRNNSVSLDIDAEDWSLSVEGDAVSEPLRFSYRAIRDLPAHALTSYLECAGNHRAIFDLVKGQPASGTQWMTGAVSNGEWVGAHLSDVLTLVRHQGRCPQRRVDRPGHRITGRWIPLCAAGGESDAPRHGAGLRAERRDTAPGPRLSGARPGSRLGGQRKHQVAGSHRGVVGTKCGRATTRPLTS